ncbi:MAG: 4Fe-4S dicluster domain-containing protein [Anaerolineales bacterium]|nr:4Fe-4S dicluster domain-containing protein [Anaerolineales bacterium]
MSASNTFQGFLDLAGVEKPSDDIINTCVRCGLCLSACPTYRETYAEASSPRGRIALIRGIAEDRLEVNAPGFLHQMDECLGCLACQAVCPSGVKYGHLLEAGRAQARAVKPRQGLGRLIEAVVFRYLFMDMGLFRLFGRSLWLYQRTGLQALARRLGLLKLMGMADVEQLTPAINDRFFFASGQRFSPNGHTTPERPVKRVALLTGCVQSVAFAHVHEATVRVLQVNGCEVVAPIGQGCCGALHAHGGDFERARQLARQNLDALEAANPDYIVTNAAGCSHHLKEYAHLLAHDPVYAGKASSFLTKARDITELLAELGPKPAQTPLLWQVTYQEPCHLAHGQKITGQPRRVLAAIPGLKLVEMKDSAMCCGSAGTYNIVQPEMSQKLLANKMDNIAATGATVVASANTGCMIQMQAGINQRQAPLKLMHLVEILDAAYQQDGLFTE